MSYTRYPIYGYGGTGAPLPAPSVGNISANYLDGLDSLDFSRAGHTHLGEDITTAVPSAITADQLGGVSVTGWIEVLDDIFALDHHLHTDVYSPTGHTHDYSASNHLHTNVYSPTGHAHANTVYDPETVLLVNFEDICGGTTYKRTRDISQFRRPVVVTGGSISNAQKKYGTYSALLDGIDDYVYIPLDDILFHAFDGDYTIECQLRFSDDPYAQEHGILGMNLTLGGLFALKFVPNSPPMDGFFRFERFGPVWVDSDTQYSLVAETWYHFALVQKAGAVRIFLDGTMVGSGTQTMAQAANSFTKSAATPTDGITFGVTRVAPAGNKFFKGNIDEIRISTTARYWANFTPPVAALSPYL